MIPDPQPRSHDIPPDSPEYVTAWARDKLAFLTCIVDNWAEQVIRGGKQGERAMLCDHCQMAESHDTSPDPDQCTCGRMSGESSDFWVNQLGRSLVFVMDFVVPALFVLAAAIFLYWIFS